MAVERQLRDTEVAEILNVKPVTLSVWRQKGIGPPFIRISSRCIRYPESAVVDYIRSKTA